MSSRFNSTSILIVTFNSQVHITGLLQSLIAQGAPPQKIFVIDNASSDDTLSQIFALDSTINVHALHDNIGFASGVNFGINLLSTENVLLLNPDIIIGERFLENAQKYVEACNCKIVGFRSDGPEKDMSPLIDFLGHPIYVSSPTDRSFYLTGSALFFDRNIYLSTGGLDSNFFMYFEETDWFWRLHLYGIPFCSTNSAVYTHESQSLNLKRVFLDKKMFVWRNRNCLLMLIKNYSLVTLLWVLPIYFLVNMIEMLFFLILLRPDISLSYIDGLAFNIMALPQTLTRRKYIQSQRINSDAYILSKMYPGFAKLHHLVIRGTNILPRSNREVDYCK